MQTEFESSERAVSPLYVFNMLRLGKRNNVNVSDPKYRRVPQIIKRSGMTMATVRFLAGDSLRQLFILKDHIDDAEGLILISAIRKCVKTIKISMFKSSKTFKKFPKIGKQSKYKG